MGKITYNDKVKINELTDVPAINKVQDIDMNEIKTSVNTIYDALGLGTDTYSTSTSYVVGDMVIYNGMIYKCTNATSGAWNSANWSLVPVSVDEKINRELLPKDIITVYRNADYSITQTSVYEIIPFDGNEMAGTKLTLNSSGGVVIGAGVTNVKTSAKITLVGTSLTAGNKNLVIRKNGTIVDRIWARIEANNSYMAMPNRVIPVNEGDVITLAFYGTQNDKISGTSPFSQMTVEVV